MANITNNPNEDLTQSIGSTKQLIATEKAVAALEKLIEARKQVEAKEAEIKAQLKELIKQAYFDRNEDAQTIGQVLHTFDIAGLQINFVNAYVVKDAQHAQTLAKLLGANHPLLKYIQESQKLVIDVTGLSATDANQLAKNVTEECIEYGIRPTVDRKTVMHPDFHHTRHVVLSSEDNQALDKVLPLQIQVSLID